MDPIYVIDYNLDNDIKFLIYDVLRMLTLQISTHIMFSLYNPSISFLNSTFIMTTIFLCISLSIFWLVIKKLFVENDKKDINEI
jgi:hypothetical protein|tara:strand:- start:55 stop:306 length:252 start_codon:yes stop_codon:yes gene_type:complete